MTTLRGLRLSDAPALFESVTMNEVARFISPPRQALKDQTLWTILREDDEHGSPLRALAVH